MKRTVQRIESPIGTFHCFEPDRVTDHLRRFGAHTRNELAMVLSFLRPGDTAIDVGAHIGTFSVPMADRVGRSGKVYSFEGSAETFGLLQRNVEANDVHGIIEAKWAVVTDRPGHYESVSKKANSGATFFRDACQAEDRPPCVVMDPWFSANGTRVDLIKVDVEGMEWQVLAGCRQLLRRFRPVLYVEVNTPGLARQNRSVSQIEAELRELGYHFFRNADVRNSATDSFIVARLEHLDEGGPFFDLLAVHAESDRYPRTAERFDMAAYRARVRPRSQLPIRALRRLRRLVTQRAARYSRHAG
jgi:FkbM family methyltransferase